MPARPTRGQITPEKKQALLRGDIIIHPFFVYAARVLGIYFYDGIDDSPTIIRLQAKHLQTAFERLAEIFKEPQSAGGALGHCWVNCRVGNFAPQHMRRGCEAINTAGLRYIPTYEQSPEFSDPLARDYLCT